MKRIHLMIVFVQIFALSLETKAQCTLPQVPIISGQVSACIGSNFAYQITNYTPVDVDPIINQSPYHLFWSINGGGTMTNGPFPTTKVIYWTQPGTYNIAVYATNSCGSSNVNTIQVTVHNVDAPPNPSEIFGSERVCANTVHEYSIAPITGLTSTWFVYSPLEYISGGVNSIKVHFPSDVDNLGGVGAIYAAYNNGHCISGYKPVFSSYGTQDWSVTNSSGLKNEVNDCINNSSTYIATLFNSSEVISNWTLSGGGILSFNGANAQVTWTSPGEFILSAIKTDDCGTVTTRSLLVNVSSIPLTITANGSTNICNGNTITLNAIAQAGLTYQWRHYGVNITNATNSSYLAHFPGIYTVDIGNPSGCSAISNELVITTCAVPLNPNPISAGGNHSLLLYDNACGLKTAVAGLNSSGQLGNGTTNQQTTPAVVSGLSGVVASAAGGSHSLFLKSDGTVWATGLNANGQLGDGTLTTRKSPVQVSSISGVIAISAGTNYSLFLKNDGTVWATGANPNGQLGDGTLVSKSVPVQVSGLTNIVAIATGADHSVFLKNDGTAYACGLNNTGQLGDGTLARRTTPVLVGGLTNTISIAAGANHSIFIRNDGSVRLCGDNTYGQLGDGTTTKRTTPLLIPSLSNISAATAGSHYTTFLKSDGTVWATGRNSSGQLGDGTLTQRLSPVHITSLSGIEAIEAGSIHTLFLKDNGVIMACGWNANGQLGDGTTTRRTTPVATVSINPCARSGQEKSTETEEVSVESEAFLVYPNPVYDVLTVSFTESIEDKITLTLIDQFGRNINMGTMEKGSKEKTISVKDLADGMYILSLQNTQLTHRRKVMVVHR
jgi:alpha-tubulin suppressor-like RCC1 family protein